MNGSASADVVDRDLIAGWLHARSIARALPMPVADHGGWRVDTRSEQEWCRYVFTDPAPAIAELAQCITQPRVYVKLCQDDAVLRALLPSHWQICAPSWMMTAGATPLAETGLPDGYLPTVETINGVVRVAITGADGALAASGYAAEASGVLVYDRIVTNPDHQRRGLGRAVMSLLQAQRRSSASREVLVATAQGRALYTSLGWSVHCPYATAVIPDAVP
ncbi:GNAT superfamily N-acetyltransferase [Sphingomonas sp. BE270]|jgi:GNAT superfamily N-acetyltransferase|uniref:GNAT family N-acetyltransferase n=1 Tax=unclassified Sphingomonas TaxID=196159 RepID=UPI00053E2339|nr:MULTISPECIES: GNAT family N-acetyltransferase [unclassified Sphingomonas]MDR6849533.1 GNAT superfamily N-acetyltransferase [Sphingomonas sp. BE137]MDR7258846.1 GNAT superfamily N-acetyltransferase [Sphingomonas sp. BE270]